MKQTPEQKKRNNLLYAFEHILSGRSVSGRKTAVDRQLMKDGYIVFDRTRKHEYPDKPEAKDNCRWATRSEQSNNRRNNHCVEVNGVSMTLAEWSRHTGISYGTIQRRREHGWADEAAVSTPVARRRANG